MDTINAISVLLNFITQNKVTKGNSHDAHADFPGKYLL